MVASGPASANTRRAGSGYNAAASHVVNPSTTTGGTLRLLTSFDCRIVGAACTYDGVVTR